MSRLRVAGLALVLVAVVFLVGRCATAPTLKFETEGFLLQYVAERDDFRDQTYPARLKCKRLDPVASEALKERCGNLASKQAVWAARDRIVLHAILSQSTITTEQIKAVADAGKDLLGLALTIAPALAAL